MATGTMLANHKLMAVGVSGDGVDQDDVVTFAGAQGFRPPTTVTRADQVFVRDVRLPFQEFNRNRIPFAEIIHREEYFMVVNATNMIDAIKTRFSSRSRKMVNRTDESYLNLRAQIEIAAATMAAIRYERENQSPETTHKLDGERPENRRSYIGTTCVAGQRNVPAAVARASTEYVPDPG